MSADASLPQVNLDEPTSYYELLQVSPKADPEIIEAAYRRLALKFHPDHNPTPEATARMQALNEAYNTLKDPQRRAEYDLALNRPFLTDDLSGDDYDYVPPRRVRIHTIKLDKIAGLVVVVLLAGLILLWLSGRDSGATDRPNPTAATGRPTMALPPGTLFGDDFESVAGANWRLDDPWHLTTRYAHSGQASLWFGNDATGHYSPNLSTAATLVRSVALPAEGTPALHFWLSGQSDRDELPTGEDRLFVEIARPGQDFQTVFTANGLYSSWQEISLDLSRWKGQPIICRFRFSSGALNSGAGFSGFFVDDVRVSA